MHDSVCLYASLKCLGIRQVWRQRISHVDEVGRVHALVYLSLWTAARSPHSFTRNWRMPQQRNWEDFLLRHRHDNQTEKAREIPFSRPLVAFVSTGGRGGCWKGLAAIERLLVARPVRPAALRWSWQTGGWEGRSCHSDKKRSRKH